MSNRRNNKNDVIDLQSSNDEYDDNEDKEEQDSLTTRKKPKKGLTFSEYWKRAFEYFKTHDDWRALLPDNLAAFLELCQDWSKLQAAQNAFFERVSGQKIYLSDRDNSETLFYMFFMLEKFPAVFVEKTYEHCKLSMVEFREILEFLSSPNTAGKSEFSKKFQPFCQKFAPFDWLEDITGGVGNTTIFGLLETQAAKWSHRSSPSGDLHSECPSIQYVMARQRVMTYDDNLMEQIQASKLMTNSIFPWNRKHEILWQIWLRALQHFENKPDLAHLPTTVSEMDRLRKDTPQYHSAANKFYGALCAHNYIWRGPEYELNTLQKGMLFEFLFHANHDKKELSANAHKYIPASVLKKDPHFVRRLGDVDNTADANFSDNFLN